MKRKLDNPILGGTQPHQINAPSYKDTCIEPEAPFINKYGVVIGDSRYSSEGSPLENWSAETDPEIMAGEEWVHPTNDIGWNSPENRELLEANRKPDAPFQHPDKDVSSEGD